MAPKRAPPADEDTGSAARACDDEENEKAFEGIGAVARGVRPAAARIDAAREPGAPPAACDREGEGEGEGNRAPDRPTPRRCADAANATAAAMDPKIAEDEEDDGVPEAPRGVRTGLRRALRVRAAVAADPTGEVGVPPAPAPAPAPAATPAV